MRAFVAPFACGAASGPAAIFAFFLAFLSASLGEARACLRAAEVPAGDRLTLAEPVAGSREVRLAGILAPEPEPDAVAGAATLAEEARAVLAQTVSGHCLVLAPDEPRRDRYDRLVAAVRREDGLSVQDALVGRGLARVLPGLGDAFIAASLLTGENAARRAGRGLWADARFRVRTAETAGEADVGSYQLVEGRVVQAMRVGPRLYLNFGEDWQTDFTVVVAARALPRFAAAGIDPAGLTGHAVRARGVIQDLNGPLIEIEEPAALEVLDPG
jgi:endonuclease YncB( thermonuclease family)